MSRKPDDFVNTVPTAPADLDHVGTVPGALWGQADGEDGQCGVCVTPEGAASVTLNTKSERLTVRFSAGAMQALAAMLAASVTALERINRAAIRHP